MSLRRTLTRISILPLGKTKAEMQNLANAIERHAREGYAPLSLAHIPSKDGMGAIFAVMGDTIGEPAEEAKPVETPETEEVEPTKVAAQTVVQHLDASGLPVPEIIPAEKPDSTPTP